MIKFLIGFAAASGMSRAQSHSHYRNNHAPLVSSVPEFWGHVRGYVQNFAVHLPGEVPMLSGPVLDGVSELWFDDWAAYDRAFAEPEYLERIRPDEQVFADFTSLVAVFANDVQILGGGDTPPYKLIRFLKRHEGVSAYRFRDLWETEQADRIAADDATRRFASGYVQNRTLWREDLAFRPSDGVDAVDEFWFGSETDMAGFLATQREAPKGSGAIASPMTQICTATRVVGVTPAS